VARTASCPLNIYIVTAIAILYKRDGWGRGDRYGKLRGALGSDELPLLVSARDSFLFRHPRHKVYNFTLVAVDEVNMYCLCVFGKESWEKVRTFLALSAILFFYDCDINFGSKVKRLRSCLAWYLTLDDKREFKRESVCEEMLLKLRRIPLRFSFLCSSEMFFANDYWSIREGGNIAHRVSNRPNLENGGCFYYGIPRLHEPELAGSTD